MRIDLFNRPLCGTFVVFVAAVAIIGGFAETGIAQTGGRSVDFQKSGIRFQIKASVEPSITSSNGKNAHEEKRASLDVTLRISAHAVGSSFYGQIPQHFSDFALSEGSDERLYWQDQQCHQRRGLPKITVMAVDGSIKSKDGEVAVEARPRHIGKLLPKDEISAGSRLPGGIDKIGTFMAYRSVTEMSHLSVKVKVNTLNCLL